MCNNLSSPLCHWAINPLPNGIAESAIQQLALCVSPLWMAIFCHLCSLSLCFVMMPSTPYAFYVNCVVVDRSCLILKRFSLKTSKCKTAHPFRFNTSYIIILYLNGSFDIRINRPERSTQQKLNDIIIFQSQVIT